MQPQMILLLIVCILLAAQGYYLGFIRPPRALAYLAKATFIFMSFVMVPLLSYTLYLQFGAVERLSRTGLVPHPKIAHAVGLATGKGANPTWVFKLNQVNQTAQKSALDFYLLPENIDGWEFYSKSESMIFLSSSQGKMTIMTGNSGGAEIIIYMASQ
jgi:hypothetical protein